jgi:hypothetical protein
MPLSSQEIAELVKRLLVKTKSGEFHWEKGSSKEEYQLSFPSNSIVLKREFDPEDRQDYLLVNLRDEDGDILENFYEGHARSADVGAELEGLFEIARRQALKIDEGINAIFEILRAPSKTK